MRINLTTPLSDDKEMQRRNEVILAAIEQYTEERMSDDHTASSQPTQSDALREENERLRALLARTVNLAEVYAEGTGTNFKEAMAEARAALQEQSK
jgi:hypothetical protein